MAAAPSALEQANVIADTLLSPSALATDGCDAVAVGHLDALADAGFYGLAGPADAGGLGGDPATSRQRSCTSMIIPCPPPGHRIRGLPAVAGPRRRRLADQRFAGPGGHRPVLPPARPEPAARAAASHLALPASATVLAAAGSQSILMNHHGQRLAVRPCSCWSSQAAPLYGRTSFGAWRAPVDYPVRTWGWRTGLTDVSEALIDDFDVVVVGSGFGASVNAYRLAEAGYRVCVLERGRSYPPGSFPRDPRGLAANLWDPPSGLHGMFDIWAFRGLESVVSSGLGGGSLIYANVLIRKDEHWFVDEALPGGGYERWPITRQLLDPHYDAVERMLGAQRYPFEVAPYRDTPKTAAMKDAAETLGLQWLLPELAVSFANPDEPPVPGVPLREERPNLHGLPRSTCRLCGECDVGCNYGSKNTLDYTYLSRAKDHGAEIRTLSEVRALEPIDGPGGGPSGYRVIYVTHQPGEDRSPVPPSYLPTTTIRARRVVLGAGTFGTSYLLLRNRSVFPLIGPALGTRFSGNGDLLSMIVGAHRRVDGHQVPRVLDPSFGPVITSAIRMGDSHDGTGATGRGFYVEDGGNPAFLDWIAESAGALSLAGRAASFFAHRVVAHLRGHPRAHISADVSRLLGDSRISSTGVPMLAMGRDIPDGVMRLRDGNLDLDWTTKTSDPYFDRVERTIGGIASALGGRMLTTPMWLFKRAITVHALGGCPMATDDQDGVIGVNGEVFHYPGLYVVDGAAMPGPVGPNPSLTIAAFADHVADGIISTVA